MQALAGGSPRLARRASSKPRRTPLAASPSPASPSPTKVMKKTSVKKGAPTRQIEAREYARGYQIVLGVDGRSTVVLYCTVVVIFVDSLRPSCGTHHSPYLTSYSSEPPFVPYFRIEAGRGPLAGPVVAAACALPPDLPLPGLDDSKKMTSVMRDQIYDLLTTHPDVIWATGLVTAADIDATNILQAAMKAMDIAVVTCVSTMRYDVDKDKNRGKVAVLVDGNRLPVDVAARYPDSSRAIIKGDGSVLCIAAASVIAKVTRDRIMAGYDAQWPEYGFKQHQGYGTRGHLAAIAQHGACPQHRRTFAPFKSKEVKKINKRKER